MAPEELTTAAKTGKTVSGKTTVDPAEIEKFSAIAEEWWDPFGKFKPLHKFNPVRLAYIRDSVCTHFGRDRRENQPLKGLRLLDIGCGGGLVAEPMRRLGADVTAIDASERNVKTAVTHAAAVELEIDYRTATVEALVDTGEPAFDIILNLEVIEHVADVDMFLEHAASLLKPNGVMVMATINRTLKAFALAKIGAEYILRWLPAGAHDPKKFVKPEEAKASLACVGLTVIGKAGVNYNPLMDIWRITENTDVNYMLTAIKNSDV